MFRSERELSSFAKTTRNSRNIVVELLADAPLISMLSRRTSKWRNLCQFRRQNFALYLIKFQRSASANVNGLDELSVGALIIVNFYQRHSPYPPACARVCVFKQLFETFETSKAKKIRRKSRISGCRETKEKGSRGGELYIAYFSTLTPGQV